MDAKIIRPSTSPCASSVVLCRKKNYDLMVVSDYRILNYRTVKDSYSVPKIEELIVTLSGARLFTSIDLGVRMKSNVDMFALCDKYW